jgi:hypothetical protein
MAREVKENVILELSREETPKGNPIVLRVVSWNEGPPKIEKRSFWVNEEGVLRTGKNLGITAQDFETLIEKQDEIRSVLSKG